jgi:Cdc6-like AAA superfamily ATPase
MLIRVSSLSSGGRSLAYRTVTKLVDEFIHGLRPLMGVNLVAGLTGSGKTLLGERCGSALRMQFTPYSATFGRLLAQAVRSLKRRLFKRR